MSTSVLLVEYDADDRRRMGGWLAKEGYDVLVCPGPSEPDYSCLGARGQSCPLAKEADIVVLDMRLASDEMMEGTPGWELLLYYMENGKRIVALSDGEDPVHPRSDEGVTVIRRPPDRETLVGAVRDFVGTSSAKERGRRGDDPAG